MMRSVKFYLLAVTTVIFLTASQATLPSEAAAAVITYDLATDWSDTINPNSPWSYNQGAGTPITTHQADYDPGNTLFATAQPAWANTTFPNLDHVPAWFKVVSSNTADLPIGTVGMHGTSPPPNSTISTPAGVSWTSNSDAVVNVFGNIWIARDSGRSAEWTLFLNNTSLTSGDIFSGDSFDSANPFDFSAGSGGAGVLSFSVTAGDVINLQIEATSASGTPIGEFAGVNMTIEAQTTEVPEPATLVLLGLGLAGLGFARRNRIA